MAEHLDGLDLKLGRKTDEGSLDPIPRVLGRKGQPEQTFYGYDLWNAYEVSFLLPNGKPVIYHLQLVYDAHSPNIVESKSLKLFLNAQNNRVFESIEAFSSFVGAAMKETIGTEVGLEFYEPEHSPARRHLPGFCIDRLELADYDETNPAASLKARDNAGDFAFNSHLLRSRCPVTNQPDWGAVYVKGSGKKLPLPESLMTYLVACRNRQDFHETCCETLFLDLYGVLEPEFLQVICYYTRRGGIDINPLRTTDPNYVIQRETVWRQ